MKRRLFVFDVDGTLIPYGSSAAPADCVAAALRKLRSLGHLTALCTGRTLCDIEENLLSVGFDGIISGGGSNIRSQGKCIRQDVIEPELLRLVVDQIAACKITCVLEGTHCFYYAGHGSRSLPWDFPWLEAGSDVTGTENIEKFTAHVSSQEEFDRIRPFLETRFEIYTIEEGRFYEMALRGRNKAAAICQLTEHMRVSLEDVVAFGDSRNDYSMLQIAGTGIVMGNAPEDVKAIASFVTGSVAEHGVVTGLKWLGVI